MPFERTFSSTFQFKGPLTFVLYTAVTCSDSLFSSANGVNEISFIVYQGLVLKSIWVASYVYFGGHIVTFSLHLFLWCTVNSNYNPDFKLSCFLLLCIVDISHWYFHVLTSCEDKVKSKGKGKKKSKDRSKREEWKKKRKVEKKEEEKCWVCSTFFCKECDKFLCFFISKNDFRIIILKEPSNLFLSI